MTSNIGAELISKPASLGFSKPSEQVEYGEEAYQKMKEKLLAKLKRTFRPEFLNRVDGIIVFKSLTREEIKQIVELELDKIRERLKEREISLIATDEARGFIADEGYSTEFGARHLKRVIQRLIEDPLSEAILAGEFNRGDTVIADLEEGMIKLKLLERN
jgi:ATP-dependent Clp protease ATP-binding subunit ClpC